LLGLGRGGKEGGEKMGCLKAKRIPTLGEEAKRTNPRQSSRSEEGGPKKKGAGQGKKRQDLL